MNTFILIAAAAVLPWQTPEVNSINRLPARCLAVPCESEELAIAVAKWQRPASDSRWVMSLDGTWDFRWKREPSRDWEKSATIAVPSCWQLQGEYDPPLYVNTKYPIRFNASGDPMGEPEDKTYTSYAYRNPVGLYKTTFRRPWRWWFRRTVLRFEGVSSAFYVRVNGKDVGYSEDSRLPAEFDLTPYLKWFGENTLEVEVYKHCDGTFLEDQDFWRLSGIFRSVMLVSERKDAPKDFVVETKLADDYSSASFVIRDEKGNVLKERQVEKPYLWSCERPNVYMTPMEHKWGWWIFGGTDYYIVSFGLRKVEIRDSVIYVNGRRAIFRGANRHEMLPESGYTLDRAAMRRDVEGLKSFNVNAVRTCHYPDAPDWYDLCDREGLMLVCEANVEAHGVPGFYGDGKQHLPKNPRFHDSIVERNVRMFNFYRNHPSILIWSLGNESGDGPAMADAYKALKSLDPTRPVQYEGAQDSDHSDVKCPMYMPPWSCEKYVANKPAKPMVLCEYTHAMGNSNGAVSDYWDLVRKYPSFQGGFVWDFVDQALWKTDARGKSLAYGGDFGDQPNDDNFNCNGIVDALRNPHPGAYELKHAYRPIRVESFDWATGVARVTNGYAFTDLADLDEISWTAVGADGQVTAKGVCDEFPLAPGASGELKLKDVVGESVTIRFAFDGRIVAWDSFTKPFVPTTANATGTPLAEVPFRLNLWRAPTDNDRGWKMPEVCKVWREATESQKLPAGVTSDLKAVKLSDGTVRVDWTLVVPKGLPPIPRVGLTFTVPAAADAKVAYLGLGPWENYADRAKAAFFGLHEASVGLVSGLADPATGTIAYPEGRLNPDNYTEPGEQGYRTGCRKLTVGDVEISAVNAPFGFNVWPYPQTALEQAKHQPELAVAADGRWTVNVDAVQMGVGGDNSWGARPHDAYLPGAGTYRLVFTVRK